MRTLVDIPEQQIKALKCLCQSMGLSRAEAIRRAITDYIDQHDVKDVDAFGLWKEKHKKTEDGLEYQQRLRDEW